MLAKQLLPYEIEDIVHQEIKTVLREKNHVIPNISNNTKINADLGITSLEFARLVSLLEDKLKLDPFMEMISITSIRTVNDLIGAYQQAQ